jgi:hypothetical protein
MNRSYSKIRHIQESNSRLEKRLISEQSPTNYSASGSYYYDGEAVSKIWIYIKDSEGNIILQKSDQSGNLTIQQLYQRFIKSIQQELSTMKITGVVLPKIEQLQKVQGSSDMDLTSQTSTPTT